MSDDLLLFALTLIGGAGCGSAVTLLALLWLDRLEARLHNRKMSGKVSPDRFR